MNPIVTLAVTTRNRTTYLGETLACVLAQDYPHLDILVSDNGSTDETREVTRALVKSDRRVRLRHNDASVNQHEHFTQCVREARGEYFVLLHDDDRINHCFVSELVGVATRHPDVNVVVPLNITIDESGALIREFGNPNREVLDGPAFICDWLHGSGPEVIACVCTILARTQVIENFGGYRCLGGGRNIDNLLFLQCALTSRVGFAHRAQFSYRTYAKSYGNNATPLQIVDSGCQFLRYLRNDPPTVRALSRVPSTYRKRITQGVAKATAKEVVLQMNALNLPCDRHTVTTLLKGRRDVAFLYVIFREYLRHSWPGVHSYLRELIRHRVVLPRRRTPKNLSQ